MTDPARLYLVTPVLEAADPFASALATALDAAPVDCVLLRLPPHDDVARRRIAAALVPVAQERGAALLLEGDTRLAAATGADGVHMAGAGDDLAQALRSMKPDRIVGAGLMPTRDDAMEAGEAGVDYLMFGDDGQAFEDRLEQVAWWAEIFQVPCVALAETLAEVRPLAEAGPEFIGLGAAVWDDPRGPAAAVAEVAATLDAVAEAKAAALAEQ